MISRKTSRYFFIVCLTLISCATRHPLAEAQRVCIYRIEGIGNEENLLWNDTIASYHNRFLNFLMPKRNIISKSNTYSYLTYDELQSLNCDDVDIDIFRKIIKNARRRNSFFLWKGSRLAIVSFKDSSKRRVAISYYGGVLKTLDTREYYVIDKTDMVEWEKLR